MSQLPLAVTVGFSGPRRWLSKELLSSLSQATIQKAAEEWLLDLLVALPAQLGMSDGHFLTGISQIAIGGDQAFTLACQELGIPQRISLPQPSDAYLAACGSDGADFPDDERERTRALLGSPHIIEESVAATTASRHLRFEETNIELVRQSDVIIAMVRAGDEGDGGKRGGTWDVIRQAKLHGIPVLLVKVSASGQHPQFDATWEGGSSPVKSGCKLPELPSALRELPFQPDKPVRDTIPPKEAYFTSVKSHCSREAGRFSRYFQSSALIIIGTHTAATIFALLAMTPIEKAFSSEKAFEWTLAVLLAVEAALLLWGFMRHHKLHENEAAPRWAMNRLLSELARSAIAFGRYHTGFRYLQALDLPASLAPLLRTMEILHLRETRIDTCHDWRTCRDAYVATRLTDPGGQLPFYRRKAKEAEIRHHRAHLTFTIASIAAIAATSAKLIVVALMIAGQIHHPDVLKTVLGFFGVFLPVLAVAALSYAAAHDLEARAHTFTEMAAHLEEQVKLLQEAASEREFARLMSETEGRILGETVTWYSRRSFTGVA
jgi:hypothetical protein